jgi:NAD(P)-dependent dehydrogenase (short-subunit alcohol dehydrogenase family)
VSKSASLPSSTGKKSSLWPLALGGLGLWAAARALRRRPAIDFRGRVVLITGGSRGLGLLIARELASQGAHLALVARDAGELESARGELAGIGCEILALPCDIRDPEEIERAVAATVERFGRLDVLVNNAGIIQVGPLSHMGLDDFANALAVHFWAPLHAVRAALPHLRRQEGARIVNVSSIGGKVAIPHMAPYSASKFALVGLSNALAHELAREGIGVTTVCPGLMRTGSHVHAEFKGRRDRELGWFAAAGALPLSSMDGRRAARQIVDACRHGEPHVTLGWQARLAAAGAALAPGSTARLMDWVNRLLPEPTGASGDEAQPGWRQSTPWAPSLLTALIDQAAIDNNELHGQAVEYGMRRPPLGRPRSAEAR